MARIERSIEIHKQVEEVFQFTANWQNLPKFCEEFSDLKPTTEKTWGNGARFAFKVKVLGVTVALESEIHNFVENKGWTGVSVKGLEHQSHWLFAPRNNKTEFTYILDYKMPIPIISSVLDNLFIKKHWEKLTEKWLQNLKRILEG